MSRAFEVSGAALIVGTAAAVWALIVWFLFFPPPGRRVTHRHVLDQLSCPVLPEDFGNVPNAAQLAADLNASVCAKGKASSSP